MTKTNPTIESDAFRIIDANLNRLKEGIRVIEDVYRYIYNNQEISTQLKHIRHSIKADNYRELLLHRDIKNDVLKKTTVSETNRKSIKDIVIANFKRAEESSRVLEEIYKLFNTELSEHFKNIRYSIYDLETRIIDEL
jgi:thiamine-phosphate pyrophosphorylase